MSTDPGQSRHQTLQQQGSPEQSVHRAPRHPITSRMDAAGITVLRQHYVPSARQLRAVISIMRVGLMRHQPVDVRWVQIKRSRLRLPPAPKAIEANLKTAAVHERIRIALQRAARFAPIHSSGFPDRPSAYKTDPIMPSCPLAVKHHRSGTVAKQHTGRTILPVNKRENTRHRPPAHCAPSRRR